MIRFLSGVKKLGTLGPLVVARFSGLQRPGERHQQARGPREPAEAGYYKQRQSPASRAR